MRPGVPTRGFTEGEGWALLVEKEEDVQRRTLTRWISTFRKVGERYRRGDEVHRQRLYGASEISAGLRGAGLQVQMLRAYGDYDLPEGHAAFVARKPA